LFAALPLVAAKRTKTDILYLTNGDRITCESVHMEHGYLDVKMPYTKGTVTINWQQVARLASSQLLCSNPRTVVTRKAASQATQRRKTVERPGGA
jgi:hypothetical protein